MLPLATGEISRNEGNKLLPNPLVRFATGNIVINGHSCSWVSFPVEILRVPNPVNAPNVTNRKGTRLPPHCQFRRDVQG